MNHRAGESANDFLRSNRYISVGESVYFATREKQNVGPFFSMFEAKRAMERYIDCIKAGQSADYARQLVIQPIHTTTSLIS